MATLPSISSGLEGHLLSGLAIAAVCAGGGQASTADDALRSLEIRSEGLNLLYGLAAPRKGALMQSTPWPFAARR